MTGPFTIERVLPMMDEAGVDRVVIVPPGLNDRNDYALEAAGVIPTASESWAAFALEDAEIGGAAAAWKQQPGMLGVA